MVSGSNAVLHGPHAGPSVFDIELRLQEVLTRAPAWPPCRERVEATLDALTDVSRMPSAISDLVATLIRELKMAIMAPRKGQEPGTLAPHQPGRPAQSPPTSPTSAYNLPSAVTYFELCDSLQEDLETAGKETREQQRYADSLKEVNAERNEELTAADGRLDECKAQLAEKASFIEGFKLQLHAAQKQVEALLEEREDSLARLNQAHEAYTQLQEDSTQTFKEHRKLSNAQAAASLSELKHAQCLLLRAHHAHLGEQSIGLLEQPLEEQVGQAMQWAQQLPMVSTEILLAASVVEDS